MLLCSVWSRWVTAELRWSTAHGSSVGHHLQSQKGGTGLFLTQLYPLTSFLAVGKLGTLYS